MNASEPGPEAQLSALLSRLPTEIVALAKACLLELRRTFPGCYELVYEYSHSLVVSFGVTDRGYEAIVALAIYPGCVRLYFGAGKSLRDPEGILEGSASKVRFVPIESAADLDRKDIRALIDAAIEHSGAALPRGAKTRLIIKSESKKKGKPAAKKGSKPASKKKLKPKPKSKSKPKPKPGRAGRA